MRILSRASLFSLLFLVSFSLLAQDESVSEKLSVEELSKAYVESMVVVIQTGRDGDDDGIGTGFVVGDGLIATSLHVIGEGRAVRVELASGETIPVSGIEAWNRKSDLAIVRVEKEGLKPIPLGDSDALPQGVEVVAFGNPRGFDFSVVKGEVSVVSATREVEDMEMIQIAIPVEPGNSGGPLMDMYGRVQGIMTMKSAFAENIGFAMPVNSLKAMLQRPNPMTMERWLKVGALDSTRWMTRFGARWTQRAGRIHVKEAGTGFSGRALCLATDEPESVPYEVGVHVKLNDESGAAGLVFGSDGDHVHYGFYPTAGELRLTHFKGPTVFNWRIIETFPSQYYRPGEWNAIKVRVEKECILCYVNDQLVLKVNDPTKKLGKVGLAKFRDTEAQFRGFQFGDHVSPMSPTLDSMEAIASLIKDLPVERAPDSRTVTKLQPFADDVQLILARKARRLEMEAEHLRKLAREVHIQSVVKELDRMFSTDEVPMSLFRAAVLISRLDNHEVRVSEMDGVLDDMIEEVRKKFGENDSDWDKVQTLKTYLFEEAGFHGSRHDYDHPANSYVDRVLEDREGLPITLSVIFIEMAERLGIRRVVGVPLPSHFVVRYLPDEGSHPLEFMDPFNGGELMTLDEAAELVEENTGMSLRDEHLLPASEHQIIMRMLMNLASHTFREDTPESTLPYLEAMVTLNPDAPFERWSRGMMRYRVGNNSGAREDFKWLLDNRPRGVDLERVNQLYHSLSDQ